jgi:hypothetical protein
MARCLGYELGQCPLDLIVCLKDHAKQTGRAMNLVCREGHHHGECAVRPSNIVNCDTLVDRQRLTALGMKVAQIGFCSYQILSSSQTRSGHLERVLFYVRGRVDL